MFPLPMLATTPVNLDTLDSRHAFRYHLAFMKNTILRALNNIYAQAREFQSGDARLAAFLEYIAGFCDILVLHIRMDACLFQAPVITDIALEKLLGEGCVQDMRKVVHGAKRLKKLARKYTRHTRDYDGREIIAHLSFGEEFSARSWAQMHTIDPKRLEDACSEAEMRDGLRQFIECYVHESDVAFLVPFIHSHHDNETSLYWPTVSPEGRIMLPCLAKTYARSWELAPFDISTGRRRRYREHKTPPVNVQF
ncbi:hypothetical protein B0F90DRAFT_1136260 [Multifurca ochricompacta]|uniref:Hemerythrin-like domain-containing protein n=1 Tax=Multifurca ochricompacta TaxID=376703 RepID=A0AAD4M193_9AGAM|nr:hypothetical protein B0F90DRAFT_1136260 [Multifurca ochricompacta]